MTFPITIKYYKKEIRLSVELIYQDERIEKFRIAANNGVIEIESNRPFFRNKNLKHRSDWKQIGGKSVSDHVIQLIAETIRNYLEKEGK